MFELTVNNIKKYMEGSLILKNISFQVYSGEKVGIVGVNGSGKSTILKIIAGILPFNYWPGYPKVSSPGYDEGWVVIPREATCAYLEQVPEYKSGLKVIDILKLAFEDIYNIENEMHELEEKMKFLEVDALEKALKQYSDLTQLYEAKGGYDAEEKLSKICTGLKFSDSFLNRDFNLLSGGEKTTVLLGKLLIDDPDILLLDEPTNHLDMDSIEWLEGYLKGYKGIVIVVSHDRYFLDNVVSKIVEVEDKECMTYRGNYSAYIYQKEENLRVQYENFREQQKKINTMKDTVKNLRDWAMRADNNKFFKRAASIQIKLDKMDKIANPTFQKKNMKLDLKAKERSGNDTIKVIGLSKSFEDKVIFKDSDLMVKFGERVALIGPNGSGKTTLLKLLFGEEKPDAGTAELGASVMAAYLPQNITFKNEELTVLECFREDISIVDGKAREYLSKFMFFGGTVFKKVRQLSGGEKIRLKLSKLLYEDVNLLILDEPTNHLDIESIETFEEALEEFNGTIFFISHDRYFINKIGERVVALEDKTFKSYAGNYDYYKKLKEDLKLEPVKKTVVKREKNKDQKNDYKSKKKESETAKTLKGVESVENELKEVESAMTEDGLSYDELNKLYNKKCELNKELDAAMELWLSLNS